MCWGLCVGVSWRVRLLAGRRVAESASLAVLEGLGVFADRRPEHLDDAQAKLRVGLRAKWRQLGGGPRAVGCGVCVRAVASVVVCPVPRREQPVAASGVRGAGVVGGVRGARPELGEPDGWSVAARFAAAILPGIFRLDDPCVRLRLAPEGREPLEEILAGLPAEVFVADDALGWVYQFWQKDKKDEVNASERKIGGADLGPVTQLFTENYMVRFLLENSLGAWWAARHPDSPLVKDWEFLRFDDDGNPAAGSFEGWPDTVGEVTVMDPCCGSGHFLVEAFSHVVADARRRRRPRTRRRRKTRCSPTTCSAWNWIRAVCRSPCSRSRCRRGRPAVGGVSCRCRTSPAPASPSKHPWTTGKPWPTVTNASRTPSCASTSCSATPTRLARLIDPKRAVEITDPTGLQSSFEDVDWDTIAPSPRPRPLTRETNDPATAVSAPTPPASPEPPTTSATPTR